MTIPNHITLGDLRTMQIAAIVALPPEQLALLQDAASEALRSAKATSDWLEGAIALKYADRAVMARMEASKDTGTVRFEDGAVTVIAELPKRVDWDQAQLADLVERISAAGDDPTEYVDVSFKVPERKYAAWPESIRQSFAPARTVRTGALKVKLELNGGGQ
ncbi:MULTISPECIES: hypothetical protein [Hyphomicrobiales]|jgi:hypothetical protein|uniref:Uncharacterized protein n=2 Tax=Hyphomicrobiales TaxID=356 RepID=A0A0K6I710_9HYPH|nr:MULTISPECIES: hypothetical protein [Hyphomicrobiales]KAB2678893.1 hypothetical protein F9K78_20115 [Brucella pseudintermedia]MCO7728348.1 hypothetical protein [Brucella intermedia]PWU71780.1 hypothetical protein DK867_17555 [Ochrobactrum sp. POC9]CUA98910.1 hypothetical protein Ga0061067_11170 [Pannonibacter indicus]